MTDREKDSIECAIRHIKSSLDVDPWAMEIAVDAMEKQIPKKPKVIIDTWSCPTCAGKVEYQTMLGENIIYHGGYDFCQKCGQAIDWSEC